MMLGTIADLMGQLGKAAIGIGITMKAVKMAFKTPAAAIAAGVALVAASAALGAVVNKMGAGEGGGGGGPRPFANGGVVFGPTLGLMGEYGGASRNPEVVAPLNKLQGMIGSQESMGGEVVFRISGTDLYGVLERYKDKITRGG